MHNFWVLKVLNQRIRKYYITLGTTVINSQMLPPYLVFKDPKNKQFPYDEKSKYFNAEIGWF